jgi:hypothetical protein
LPYMAKETGRSLAKLIIIGMCVQLLVIGYVFYQSYQGRVDVVNSQRAGCERGKLDRTDNADFQRAHAEYIRKVVLAASVKQDVKDAAYTALDTFSRTSASLTKRAKINCEDVYPKVSLIP